MTWLEFTVSCCHCPSGCYINSIYLLLVRFYSFLPNIAPLAYNLMWRCRKQGGPSSFLPKVSRALTNVLLPSLPISRHFMKGWDWVSNQAPSRPDARERGRGLLRRLREGFAKNEGAPSYPCGHLWQLLWMILISDTRGVGILAGNLTVVCKILGEKWWWRSSSTD